MPFGYLIGAGVHWRLLDGLFSSKGKNEMSPPRFTEYMHTISHFSKPELEEEMERLKVRKSVAAFSEISAIDRMTDGVTHFLKIYDELDGEDHSVERAERIRLRAARYRQYPESFEMKGVLAEAKAELRSKLWQNVLVGATLIAVVVAIILWLNSLE